MAKKDVISGGKKVGHYAFLAGIVIAVVAGVFTDLLDAQLVPLLLLVLGLLVGLLNVTGKEMTEFLIAGIALALVSVPAGVLDIIRIGDLQVGMYLGKILLNISVFVTFAVLVVALKAVWELAED
ncbi:hypothetical protein HY639_02990 [Candidatus Woesearchaeota archaeon]|nr:hypothetical protein [Candidatus Woesearchaeota archaeon]